MSVTLTARASVSNETLTVSVSLNTNDTTVAEATITSVADSVMQAIETSSLTMQQGDVLSIGVYPAIKHPEQPPVPTPNLNRQEQA
jgi:hypothetical protein